MKKAAYYMFCVVLVNTAFFAILTLFAIDFFVATQDTAVYSSSFQQESYTLTPLEKLPQLWKEFDTMGEQESYQYNPWTTFIERPFQGELLNVDLGESFPIRRTIPQTNNSGEQLLVWVFGGSTMFGWGVSDENTIASHLQQILQRQYPSKNVRVINHGHSYYHSSLETSLFVALLRQDTTPDIAIFLDGLNDVWAGSNNLPYFAPQAANAWEAERNARNPENQRWFRLNGSFPLAKLKRSKLLKESAQASRDRTPRPLLNPQENARERVEQTVKRVKANISIAKSAGRALGVKTIFFLQPLSRVSEQNPIFSETYSALRSMEFSADISLTDISQLLEESLEHPFVDNAHYSDSGNLEVAKRIADVIFAENNY